MRRNMCNRSSFDSFYYWVLLIFFLFHRVLKNAFSRGISYPGKNVNKTQWNSVANVSGKKKQRSDLKCFIKERKHIEMHFAKARRNYFIKLNFKMLFIVLAQNRRLIQKLKVNCWIFIVFQRSLFARSILQVVKIINWQKVWRNIFPDNFMSKFQQKQIKWNVLWHIFLHVYDLNPDYFAADSRILPI